jgi:RND family efflux transporter MFP subunit
VSKRAASREFDAGRTLAQAAVLAVAAVAVWAVRADAQAEPETFRVETVETADSKAVFATVESVNVVPARARIGGTVAELTVDEGDLVETGATLAVVASQTLALQIEAINARIGGLVSQNDQAQADLARAEELAARGTIPQTRLEEFRTNAAVVGRQLEEARAERAVLVEQVSEGAVLAPTAGRVLEVPITVGTVVLPGEQIASVAAEDYVLRLRLPERHARFLAEGDEVRVDASALGGGEPRVGRIEKVYPEILDGRVVADAAVDGLGDFFVGERVRVWVSTETRETITIPRRFVSTRHGVDFVQVRGADDALIEVAVQLGPAAAEDGDQARVEILSGLGAGDVLVAP